MSRYRKNKYKKKTSWKSVVSTIFVFMLALVLLSAFVSLIRSTTGTDEVELKTIYFIPSDAWAEDGSLYGAWCWSDTGLPGSKFVLASDEDEDGIYELKINTAYTGINFVDLKPNTDNLGLNWANKREQSDNIDLPTDNKVYYHQYANEWTSSSEKPWVVTTAEVEVTLVFDSSENTGPAFSYFMYVFDKTGKLEAQFIEMTDLGDGSFAETIPAGYTHLIFVDCDATWDNVEWQTEDLVIPADGGTYDASSGSWQ